MFRTAIAAGPRPASLDLPPTLQPMAITQAAPRTDRRLAFLGAMVIYGCMPLAMLAVEGLMPRAPFKPAVGATNPEKIYEFHLGSLDPSVSAPPAGGSAAPRMPDLATPQLQTSNPRPIDDANVETPQTLPATFQGSTGIGNMPGLTSNEATPHGDPRIGTSGHGDSDAPGPVELSAHGLQILKQVDPTYPPVARAARIQGDVVLRMVVDERGLPIHAEVVEGPALLRAEALRAAKQWAFSPARVGGETVKATFLLTLKFRLI